jgi:hypothetical protein
MEINYQSLVEKWSPVLNEESAGSITDRHKRNVTAAILENQEAAMIAEGNQSSFLTEAAPANNTAGTANWNPVLISLVRRAMPNLMAYDVCGVQPMSGPTGLIFAMKSQYKTTKNGATANDEALFDEANSAYSSVVGGTQATGPSGLNARGGDGTVASATVDIIDSPAGVTARADRPDFGTGYTTAAGEALGDGVGAGFAEMGFTIEKATVTAKTRALKAEYTIELAQDLKAIHGLDAEAELANILSTEVLAEINREVVRTINNQAKTGGLTNTKRGVYDLKTDADGRWQVEKYKALMLAIEFEANIIAKETRRGKGNVVICSSDVASALASVGMLDYTPALANSLQVDDTGNTFAGVMNGRTKVYIDPYASVDYVTVGFKGTNPYDAGVFYCPYVPLQMVRAVGEQDFQPRIGFKTRYGMVSNPYVDTANVANRDGLATEFTNQYYRIFKINGLNTTP